MKKKLIIQKGEPLHKWLDRIAEYWNFGKELRDMLETVSKESYIQGSNAAIKALKENKQILK